MLTYHLQILPLLAIGYMFAQLDRSNLGNAQTAGFSTDLGLRSNDVNTAASLFYATYVPVQPLATAFGRRIGAARFMGGLLFVWGALTIGHAFIKNDAQLIALRLLMGLAECGFYPSALAYMSEIYPRYELATRYAVFYGMASLAGAFGGLIAYGILQVNSSLKGWQYLFIIEGIIPMILGLIVPFWLARDVSTAWYLKAEERAFAQHRLVIDSASNANKSHKVSFRNFKEAFADWQIWGIMLSNMLASISSQGFTIFMPVVVKGMGYTQGTLANAMTVPPYIAGAIGVWAIAWSSDRFQERTIHLLTGMGIVILGLILMIVIPLENVGGRYAGLVVLMFGTFMHGPVATAWLSGNIPDPGKRVVAFGISGWANIAGIIGSQLFLSQYGPGYIFPLRITIGLMSVSFAGFATVSVIYRLINRSRAKKIAAMSPAEIEEENRSETRRGNKKHTFVYGV
ncbi:MFS general substrate transporter [Thozetella sp. PMI_491]|nr:MFS general substrate transporter [Thozetella sp. PMI_491]